MARGNNARDRYMYGICTNRDNGDGKPCPTEAPKYPEWLFCALYSPKCI